MKIYSIILSILLITSLFAQPKVKTGIEVLKDSNFEVLKGKAVGLVTNASGVNSNLKSSVDILFEANEVNLVALYGPEHGVRGNIEGGDKVEFYIDEYTNLPVYSLYGKTSKPTEEMLKDIDLIVYDIQDIGCRSYTFISTMGKVMEAAAEFNKEVVVLDRPNPLGGNRVEGLIVEDEYISFISQFKIPYVYGLTCGELAVMLNEEGMLSNGIKCDLKVIEMERWNREMSFEDTGLPWVPTSPHIPQKDSPFYYVSSGIVGELRDAVSIGVGYTIPFQSFAAEWINGIELSNLMNSYQLPGVIFRPLYYRPYYAHGKGKDLGGVQIHIVDFKVVDLMKIQLYFLQAIKELYPDTNIFDKATKGQLRAFDKAIGTNRIREKLKEDQTFDAIKSILSEGVKEFIELSRKYYLYN
jgi:uncharacterized protein YbbC (DUF1343 family)